MKNSAFNTLLNEFLEDNYSGDYSLSEVNKDIFLRDIEELPAIIDSLFIQVNRLNKALSYDSDENIYFDLKLHDVFSYSLGIENGDNLFNNFCNDSYQDFKYFLDNEIESSDLSLFHIRGSRYYFNGQFIHDLVSSHCYNGFFDLDDLEKFGGLKDKEQFILNVFEIIKSGVEHGAKNMIAMLKDYLHGVKESIRRFVRLMKDYRKVYNYVEVFKSDQIDYFKDFIANNSY